MTSPAPAPASPASTPPAPAAAQGSPLIAADPQFGLILADWQAEIQFAIEAGVAPALGVGGDNSVAPALVGIEAVRRLAEQRRDMTSPVITAGGGSGAWLSALMQPQHGQAAHSPAQITLFGGADEATQIAAAGTLPKAPAGLFAPGNRSLPNGYRPHVAPALQPAAPAQWDNLPARVLEPTPTALGVLPAGPALGWIALVFVALLILGALAL